MLKVLYHHAKFGGARVSPAAGAVNNVEFFVCLFVCLSVTLLNVSVCVSDFAVKALDYRNDFVTVGYGKVCRLSRAPVFNFLRLLPIGGITKCQSAKNRKNWCFSPTRGRQINRSRGVLAH